MDNMSLNRRSLLMAMGAISAGAPLGGVSAGGVQASGPKVLEAGHGEHLVHFRDGGNIFIYEGSDTWVFGTQQIKARGGWPASITSSADDIYSCRS